MFAFAKLQICIRPCKNTIFFCVKIKCVFWRESLKITPLTPGSTFFAIAQLYAEKRQNAIFCKF